MRSAHGIIKAVIIGWLGAACARRGRTPPAPAPAPSTADSSAELSDRPEMLALARVAGYSARYSLGLPQAPLYPYPVFCGANFSDVHWTPQQLAIQRRLATEFAAGGGGSLLEMMQRAPKGGTPIHLISITIRGETGEVGFRFSASYPGGFGIDEEYLTFARRGPEWTFVKHSLGAVEDAEIVPPKPGDPPPPPSLDSPGHC